jgi:tetratricopeptide (TPR) repeat protein
MRKLTAYRSHPQLMALKLRDHSARLTFSTMYFVQGDLYFMRGKIQEALRVLNLAAALVPRAENAARCQIFSMLATVELFGGNRSSAHLTEQTLKIQMVDRTKISYSYAKLHAGLVCAVSGDFESAENNLNKAATRVLLRKDCSPLKPQILNMLDWIHFITGKPALVIESLRTLNNGEDNLLKKIWSIELLVIIYALEGRFMRCYELLQKLKGFQNGRYGTAYREALVGMVGVMESKHLSPIDEEREGVISSLLFAAGKLTLGIQVCPIGVMCLYWTSHSLLSILHPMSLKELERNFRRGGGTAHRLQVGLDKCLRVFADTVKYLPFLATLQEALLMKQAVLLNKMIRVNQGDNSTWKKYPEFTFGKAMWILEWRGYYSTFIGTLSDAYLSEGVDSPNGDDCIAMFGISQNHVLRSVN